MRALVTGSSGFLGRHVVQRLIAGGASVRGLDLSAAHALPAIETVTGSILDADTLARAFDRVDALVHCAAIAELWVRDPAQYEAVNVEGTARVLAAAAAAGVRRAVHVSSYTTLIAGPTAAPAQALDEEVVWAPEALLGPYPAAKRRSELVAEAQAAAGLPVSIALPSAPIGPGDVNLTAPARLIRDLAAGRLPAILDRPMNLVDARSVADGIAAALEQGRPGRRYLLTGEDVEMPDLAARVARIAGIAPPRFRAPGAVALTAAHVETALSGLTGRAPGAPLTGVRLALRRRAFSSARARKELGYAPAPLDAALADAVAWLRPAGPPPAGSADP